MTVVQQGRQVCRQTLDMNALLQALSGPPSLSRSSWGTADMQQQCQESTLASPPSAGSLRIMWCSRPVGAYQL